MPKFADSLYHGIVLKEGQDDVATSFVSAAKRWTVRSRGENISVFVMPQYFGLGYGKYIFSRAVNYFNEQGHNRILLWVLEENQRAKSFYERNGFFFIVKRAATNIEGKEIIVTKYVNRKNEE